MAATLLKAPVAFSAPAACTTALKPHSFTRVSFVPNRLPAIRCRIHNPGYKSSLKSPRRAVQKFLTFAVDGDGETTWAEIELSSPFKHPKKSQANEVVPVDTVGKPFDPMLHEAIMREDSTEHEDGVVIEEYRKGFQLGERLLRPSMVKVSAGPGPAKPESQDRENQESGSAYAVANE